MGLRNALRLTERERPGNVPQQLASPWSTGDLSTIVWADLLGADLLPATRAEAMTVPAMSRSRHLIAGAIAGCPLQAARGADILPDADQPTWMYRTDTPVSPWHRMLWTVDDLLFGGWSLWAVDRGSESQILDAWRIAPSLWQFATDGRSILVDGETVPAGSVVLIPGPHEGLLSFGARTLRAASKLERAAARHASNPVPSVELHQEVDTQLTNEERDELVQGWQTARASETGAVGFTSYGIRAYPLGAVPEQLLIDGRNAAAVDVARHSNIPAAMIDATNAGASLTYETTAGRNQQFLDYGVNLYIGAIEARLSADDVVPRGQRTAFDTTSLTSLTPAPAAGTPRLD